MLDKDPVSVNIERKTQMISIVTILILVVLIVQLWLLMIALDEFLGNRATLAWPTFGASCFCLLLNGWLLKYVYDADRSV